nr:hydrolase 1, exosortase A system-associated [uncultured Roseateles sp.]
MNYQESVLSVTCGTEPLAAILAAPESPKPTAVLVIVGGPQYRVGSHRQFVLLSRRLAEAGYPVLRFDYRGMGDSGGAQRSFEQVSDDVAAAINALQAQITFQDVVLWGLCDGASAALLYCQQRQDPRVQGLCLLNPWVRSETSLARTQIKHYYLQRLKQKEFWLKLLSGKVAGQALSGLLHSLKLTFSRNRPGPNAQASFQDRMASAWHGFRGDILLLLSGDDYTAKEFMDYASTDAAWSKALSRPGLSTQHMPGLDHTCSGMAARRLAEDHVLTWLGRRGGASS